MISCRIGLAACTAMTLRMYADRKGWRSARSRSMSTHGKVHAEDCAECAEGRAGKIDRFERKIAIEGGISADVRPKFSRSRTNAPSTGRWKAPAWLPRALKTDTNQRH
jgi:uncharacterized OsmC-like protein